MQNRPAITFEDDGTTATSVPNMQRVLECSFSRAWWRVPSGLSWGTQTMDEWDAHWEANLLFLHPQGIGSYLYTLIVQSVWGPRTLASPGSLLEIQNLGPYPRPYWIRILTRPPHHSHAHHSLHSTHLRLCQQFLASQHLTVRPPLSPGISQLIENTAKITSSCSTWHIEFRVSGTHEEQSIQCDLKCLSLSP